jgi:putative FmdB family regulatory protein
MPIYEYVCQGCEHTFERLVRRFDEEVACPECASGSVDKQFSVFAVACAPASGPARCEAPGTCGAGACAGGTCGLPS